MSCLVAHETESLAAYNLFLQVSKQAVVLGGSRYSEPSEQ